MTIRELLQRLREKKELQKRYNAERRIAERYEERKLSANERELLQHQQKIREEMIKRRVEQIRKQKQKQFINGRLGNAKYIPYIVKDQKDLYHNRGLLKHRRIFD